MACIVSNAYWILIHFCIYWIVYYTWYSDVTWCWHRTLDIWYLILDIDTSTWCSLAWYCNTWLIIILDSWLSLLRRLDMIIILQPEILYSWPTILLNPCNRETPDTVLLLILVDRLSWIHYGHYTGQYKIKYSTYARDGETDGRRYDDVFIVVDYCSDVSCWVYYNSHQKYCVGCNIIPKRSRVGSHGLLSWAEAGLL